MTPARSLMTAGRERDRGRIVDLSHRVEAGMTTYPGLPGPELSEHLSRSASRDVYAPGTEFSIGRITMVGNTGTYLDSPFHRYAGGTDLAGLDLTRLVDLPAVIVSVADRLGPGRAVGPRELAGREVSGCAVLLHTGWDTHWLTPEYAGPAPYLDAAGASWLVDAGAVLVGIDSVNIDDTGPDSAGARPAHSTLLGAGIAVVEHLCRLGELPSVGARFTAAPPAVADFGTFPVRAYAIVPD